VKQEETSGRVVLNLPARLESLLFVADSPVPIGRLAEAVQATPAQVDQALSVLEETWAGRGLRLQRSGRSVQLVTAPQAAGLIERFLGLEARRSLSRAALETLSIIAYQQPITRPEVDAVRGVNSDSVMRRLASLGLIEETGRAPSVGRPVLYATSFEFLQHFGLSSLSELPALESVANDEAEESEALEEE